MIRNFFKIAVRNLVKSKGYSAINIGGLSVGMAVAILIGLWIKDELSFNKYHANYNRLARAVQQQTTNGIITTFDAMPFPMGKELQTTYGSDFKYVAMASWEGDHILQFGEKSVSKHGIYMDADAPKMLTLKMLAGTNEGLRDPLSIILSASAAKAIFGDANPLNQRLRIDAGAGVKVTGVYEDLPANTTFARLEFIAPWDLYVSTEPWVQRARERQQWDNNSFQLYVQLADKADLASVNRKILNSKQAHVDPEDKKYNSKIFLHPMADWHLRSHWDDNGLQTGGMIEYVWLFSVVGIFVLLLACINFMNLSTARAEKRAREVGVRKAIGSDRSHLVWQFYTETFLVVLVAVVLAIGLVQVALPWFNQLASKEMQVEWTAWSSWLSILGFALITGVIAGSYPAFYLSSFNPVEVLKGSFRAGPYAALPRKVLVVLQFTISLALIIGTVIVYSQVKYSKERPIGYSRDGVMMIEMKSPEFYGKFDLLREELKKTAVAEMAESSSPLTAVWSTNDGFTWPGKDPSLDVDFATIWVTHEFGKTAGWQFVAGRDFSRDFATDSLSAVINESTAKFMGIADPVGSTITWNAQKFKIIGVTKDMLMGSPYERVRETIYFLDYNNVNWIILKLKPEQGVHESIARVEAAFKKYIPSAPFDYQFADDAFAAKFVAEERVGSLAAIFAGFAIFISCLGLFGLASFVAEQRRKEIGVRKVLGASVFQVWRSLSSEFILLVTLAFIIAVPLAAYFMSRWLANYQYHTTLSWPIFAVSGLGAFVITLATVSFQAIKAAVANPVRSLRTE